MIEEKLYSLLSAVHGKTFPHPAPPSATPAFILYQRTSTVRPHDLSGSAGVAIITFQVDCYARSFKQARELANRTLRALSSYQDAATAIRIEQDRDLSDLTSDPTLYRVNLQFAVTHDEWRDDADEEA